MLKKAIPFALMSGLVLGACADNNNGIVPDNNETPMENVEDRTRDWMPNAQDDQRGGSDLDGINNNGNGGNNGNGNGNGVINNGNQTMPNDATIDNANPNTPNETNIEDGLDGNGNGTNR